MKKADIKKLEDFFLAAARATFASGLEHGSISEIYGSKSYVYRAMIEDNFYVYQDVYFNAGNGKSFGFTIISINRQYVWTMHYHGNCWGEYARGVKNVQLMNFLKKALLNAYEKKQFFGGRGIAFKERQFKYDNYCTKNNFEDFSGKESIDVLPRLMFRAFYHEYEGGLVV